MRYWLSIAIGVSIIWTVLGYSYMKEFAQACSVACAPDESLVKYRRGDSDDCFCKVDGRLEMKEMKWNALNWSVLSAS